MEGKLYLILHEFMENRNCLVVDVCQNEANGCAEPIAAWQMIEARADGQTAVTLVADQVYDAQDFVNELQSMNARPHVAPNMNVRASAIDGRTARHDGYALRPRTRKLVEELVWVRRVTGQARTKFRGRERAGWTLTFPAATCNVARLPKPFVAARAPLRRAAGASLRGDPKNTA